MEREHVSLDLFEIQQDIASTHNENEQLTIEDWLRRSAEWRRSRRKRRFLTFRPWECFKDYSTNTSIHGINYMGDENRHILEKCFWIIVFLLSVGTCCCLMYKTWIKWNSSPVIVSFAEKTTPVWDIPFPAVTICSETQVRKNVYNFTAALREYNISENPKKYQTLFDASLLCDVQILTGSNFTNENIIELFRQVVPTAESLFSYFRWGGENIKYSEAFVPTLTEEGICHTFNMIDPKEMFTDDAIQKTYSFTSHGESAMNWSLEKGYDQDSPVDIFPNRVIGAGKSTGLTVHLRSKSNEMDYTCNGAVQGFKIILHNPAELPRVRKVYSRADVNEELVVIIKPSLITTSEELQNYSPFRRQCFFPSERKLRFFQDYTQSNCQLECLTNVSLQVCECAAFYMPRSVEMPICGAGKKQCLVKSENIMLKREMKTGNIFNNSDEKCNCLPTCTGLQYEWETSSAHTEFNRLMKSDSRENICQVILFFKDTQFITTQRSELYGTVDFLANCGGLLGLFMGISVLSIIEIGYYLTIRLCYIHHIKVWLTSHIKTSSASSSKYARKLWTTLKHRRASDSARTRSWTN